MDDLRTLVRDEMARAGSPSYSFNDLGRRRDRKRRNQRIAAGAVGIAVFVAAVWIVTSGLSLDRSTPVVPGGSETGPTQTAPPVAPDAAWDGHGLPPEGTALSTPVEGELIRRQSSRFFPFRTPVSVYTDGRVIWWVAGRFEEEGTVLERRLTPQGVDLVRSGAIKIADLAPPQVLHGVPASAWADAEARTYAPPMYAICFSPDRSAVIGLLPAPAEALLRESGPDPSRGGCLEVTTEKARALDAILNEAGFFPGEPPWAAATWLLGDDGGSRVRIELVPLLPDGELLQLSGG